MAQNRLPMNTASPEAPHAEWKRFLGGIPFSHVRDLTPDERKAIRGEVLRYLAVAAGLLLIGAIVTVGSFQSELLAIGFIAAIPMAGGVGYCLAWIWPYWQTLRSGKIHLYVGHPSAIPAFDEIQAFYRSELGLDRGLGHRIEILAIGDGGRAWRLNDVSNDERLAGVRPLSVALLLGDHDSGRRSLTAEELQELRGRAKEVGRIGAHGIYLFVGGLIIVAVLPSSLAFAGVLAHPLALAIWLVGNGLIVRGLIRRQRTRTLLLQDADAGIVENGRLNSGLLWISRGWPARWRTGQPGEMSEGITAIDADVLELLSYSKVMAKENATSKRR